MWAPDGNLVDEIHFGPQNPNCSSGRYPDGSDLIVALEQCSPGELNHHFLSDGIHIIPDCMQISTNSVQLRWPSVPGLRYVIEVHNSNYLNPWRFFHDCGTATEYESVYSFEAESNSEVFYLVKEISESPKLIPLTIADGRIALKWDAVIGGLYQLEYLNNIETGNWLPFLSRRTALSRNETIHLLPGQNTRQYFRVIKLQ
jgi:hypothetical protein